MPATGSLRVTSTPSEAILKVDGATKGTTPLTVTGLSLGSHTVEVSKSGYTPYTTAVTIYDAQTTNLNTALGYVYTDTDTLPDIVEVIGFKDPFGNTRTSDPTLADTDGDGLTDDYEAGVLYTDLSGHTFWKVRSNPRKVDSDGDGLDDYSELMDYESDPLNPDTDHDLLTDGLEVQFGTDPTNPDTYGDKIGDYERYTNKYLDYNYVTNLPWKDNEIARELTLGIAKGDWASDGHDNLYYQTGQFVSQLFCVGSARDAYVDYLHGEDMSAALNAIGAVPGTKVEETLITYIGTHTGVTPRFIALVGAGKLTEKVAKAKYGTELVEYLKNTRGLTETKIVALMGKEIDLSVVKKLLHEYPFVRLQKGVFADPL